MSTVCLLVAAGTKHTVLTVGPSQGNEKKVALELGPGLPRLTLTQPQTRLVPHLLQVQEAFLEYPQHMGPPSTTHPGHRLPPSESINQAMPLPGVCPQGRNRGLCKHLHTHVHSSTIRDSEEVETVHRPIHR